MHIARWCVIWTQIQNRPEQTLDFRETSLYENLLKSTSDVSFCTSSVFGLTPYFVFQTHIWIHIGSAAVTMHAILWKPFHWKSLNIDIFGVNFVKTSQMITFLLSIKHCILSLMFTSTKSTNTQREKHALCVP